MFNNFYKFNILNLIKIRLHLGHKDLFLNKNITGFLYGTRHTINIYDLDKLWKPYRYLYYNLILNFYKRNSFFIIGINPHLPMPMLLENLINQYPFITKKDELSFYISGYMDRKWIGGLFSNWKIFVEFLQYLENPNQIFEKKFKYQKYFWYLKGIRFLEKNPIPDFFIFLDQNKEALDEINNLKVPLVGLIDTNVNPQPYLYKFWGNNDSIESISFFFDFLKDAVIEGRLKEQQLFFFYFIKKIKNIFHERKLRRLRNLRWKKYIELQKKLSFKKHYKTSKQKKKKKSNETFIKK